MENQKEHKLEEQTNIGAALDGIIKEVRKQKAVAPDGETARRLAIVITELEKVYAFALTYL